MTLPLVTTRARILNECGKNILHYPRLTGAQDTFYVGAIKGVGCIYQQSLDINKSKGRLFIDTYPKVAFVKLYNMKMLIAVAEPA
jgi:hypothetical protein